MKITMKVALMASAALIATQARAQDAAPPAEQETDSTTQIVDIVVTARKTTESGQKVPISISAFSGADLEARGARHLEDLQQAAPGLTIARQTADPSSPIITMRGQVQLTLSPSTEPSVAIYTDGVYGGGIVGSEIGQLLDLDRVEVLKGPQGTLYGRNTTGGAINFYSRTPTDRLEGSAAIGFGNYAEHHADVVLNLPILKDRIALRVVGGIFQRNGYGDLRSLPGANQPIVAQKAPESENTRMIRASLKIDPTDRLSILARADVSWNDGSGALNHPLYLAPTAGTTLTAAAVQMTGKPLAAITATDRANALTLFNLAASTDLLTSFVAYGEGTHAKSQGASLTVSYDLGGVTLKSISGYRKASSQRRIDDCSCGFDLFDFNYDAGFHLFSQEVQATGSVFDDRLKYAVGGYYLRKIGFQNEVTTVYPSLGALALNPTVLRSASTDKTHAVFAQATYSLFDGLNVTGGLRYTSEDKSLTGTASNASGCQLPAAALIPAPAKLLPNCAVINFKSDSNLSYTAGLDWTLARDVMLYVKTSRGFQAGGINLRPNTNPASISTYKPEVLTDYEAGIKSQLLDHRLQLNIAYYHSVYTDAQRSTFAPNPNPLLPGASVQGNAAGAIIDGVEAAGTVIPVHNLRLSGSLAYTRPRYTDYTIVGIDQRFLNFPLTPRWSYNLSGNYTVPASFGRIVAQLDYSWRSKQDLFPADTPGAVSGLLAGGLPVIGKGTPDNIRIQRPYGLVNGSLTVTSNKLDLDLRLYVTNLLDKRYLTFAYGAVNAGVGITSGVPGMPRMFGMELTKHF